MVSEPSNPWVSGVAGLFTVEFYQRVRKVLSEDGVFSQWLHLYETDPHVVASVTNALGAVFPDYRIYMAGVDIIFIATLQEKVPDLSEGPFSVPAAQAILSQYRLRNKADMEFFFIGDRARMHPYFTLFQSPVNSDYFPFLENNAPRAFFLQNSHPLWDLFILPFYLRETLYGMPPPLPACRKNDETHGRIPFIKRSHIRTGTGGQPG